MTSTKATGEYDFSAYPELGIADALLNAVEENDRVLYREILSDFVFGFHPTQERWYNLVIRILNSYANYRH
jgi:hypothetical protein